ncbi:Arsenate reductase, glutaredoxin family [Cognatiyoonia koreensis]|uniref:Arsenate reductase, glutaredoxin family n=1 Tax=Cognatiyoonia koreensis TaxID=364200 RepID=A0A1I0Q7V3_9RHOB|nr:ArsC/Spx/MgsR family protein [Cognatiyoonia koreensis]SEW23070.1 Arsenate reductase, glutaredoxin family [Cognatiyoonia koreensis]
MRFFGLKSCDTCRKALKAIRENGLDVTVTDVRADGIASRDQARIVEAFGEKSLNRASTTWRGLSDAEKALSPADLLSTHPTLLKRPVIEKDGVWTIGWSPDVQKSVLGG